MKDWLSDVQVVFSNGVLGIKTDKFKNKFSSVVDLYFQADKLKNISTSYQTLDLFEKIRMVGKGENIYQKIYKN